jgi:SAM-dependent methyltransferase
MREIFEEHLAYMSDGKRLDCFSEAIGKIVKPGDFVVDLGCGFGVLGLLCLRAGAAQVWGIDRTGAIEIARESMARAGLGDRYICIRETSQRVVLPELVDIVICDHVGFFGFDYGILATLDDARRRFLKPGGKVVPSCIKPMLAAVQSADSRKKAEAWRADPVPLEYDWLREHGVNTMHAVRLKPDELLSAPATLGAIDLRVDNPDFLSFATDLSIVREGIFDGLAGWFECELTEGVRMTNSPLAADAIARAQVFLPIDQPLDLKAGEQLRVSVMARPTDGVFSWSVEVLSTARRFVHSTWKSMAMTKEDIGRSQPDRMPRLTPRGQARQIVLSYCDGRRTSREIEQAVLKDHSRLFPTREEISRFVLGELGRNTQ